MCLWQEVVFNYWFDIGCLIWLGLDFRDPIVSSSRLSSTKLEKLRLSEMEELLLPWKYCF
jgi:hypothetical protein